MPDSLSRDLTYYLRGVGFRVHNALKGGHPEKVYENAVLWVLDKDNVPYQPQKEYSVTYKGKKIGKYFPDLMLANGKVAVDFKATPAIIALHKAQMLSYLGVTGAELGFIMNFGASSLQTDRLPNFLHDRKALPWQSTTPADILFPELTNHILQCLHTVQFTLGPGFLHQLYRRATRVELSHQAVNFVYLKKLPLRFETLPMMSVPARFFLIEKSSCCPPSPSKRSLLGTPKSYVGPCKPPTHPSASLPTFMPAPWRCASCVVAKDER